MKGVCFSDKTFSNRSQEKFSLKDIYEKLKADKLKATHFLPL